MPTEPRNLPAHPSEYAASEDPPEPFTAHGKIQETFSEGKVGQGGLAEWHERGGVIRDTAGAELGTAPSVAKHLAYAGSLGRGRMRGLDARRADLSGGSSDAGYMRTGVREDARDASFANADLTGAELRGFSLTGASFT